MQSTWDFAIPLESNYISPIAFTFKLWWWHGFAFELGRIVQMIIFADVFCLQDTCMQIWAGFLCPTRVCKFGQDFCLQHTFLLSTQFATARMTTTRRKLAGLCGDKNDKEERDKNDKNSKKHKNANPPTTRQPSQGKERPKHLITSVRFQKQFFCSHFFCLDCFWKWLRVYFLDICVFANLHKPYTEFAPKPTSWQSVWVFWRKWF